MSFINFALAHGVEVSDLYACERIKRCPTTENPRKKNGAYFWDGRRGWVMAWDGDARVHWYDDPAAPKWTDEEKRSHVLRHRQHAEARERQYELAAMRAASLLNSSKPGCHDYLTRKGLPDASGLCLPDGGLLVPMRHLVTNQIQGAQIIRWIPEEMRWDKKMIPGMRAKGAVLRLGPPKARETVLCEGYATGLSIEAAIRQLRLSMSVLVCFSDSNMVHIASMVRGECLVFADHDASGAGLRAARATGMRFCMSGVVGEDANDLHARAGVYKVASLLMDARASEVSVPS